MEENPQTFSVHINHQRLEETYFLHKSDDWQKFDVPVPAGLLRQGNNLVTLKFSVTARKEGVENWRAAGELESFHLIQ